jgi:hypothetical protein
MTGKYTLDGDKFTTIPDSSWKESLRTKSWSSAGAF